MQCPKCSKENCVRNGKDRDDNQRFKCRDCKKNFSELKPRLLGRMQLPVAKAIDCLKLILDGMSIRACERFTGVSRNTICDLIIEVGERCRDFMASHLQGVPVADVQVDEVWSYVGRKEKTKIIAKDYDPTTGDSYAYIALERNSKLIVTRAFPAARPNSVSSRRDEQRTACTGIGQRVDNSPHDLAGHLSRINELGFGHRQIALIERCDGIADCCVGFPVADADSGITEQFRESVALDLWPKITKNEFSNHPPDVVWPNG